MQKGMYFTDDQWLACDGGFMGDGPIKCSYDNPGNNAVKIAYNLIFKEVRAGIETAFSRVCMWFPILGVNKAKWNYDSYTLELSIHAASKLHNWLMNTEGLSYSANTSAENMFRPFY